MKTNIRPMYQFYSYGTFIIHKVCPKSTSTRGLRIKYCVSVVGIQGAPSVVITQNYLRTQSYEEDKLEYYVRLRNDAGNHFLAR
jgi:hypothetical protein